MIEELTLIHLSKEVLPASGLETELLNLQSEQGGDIFVLSTCQRTLIFGHGATPLQALAAVATRLGHDEDIIIAESDVYKSAPAYRFLLEVLLGLKSQVLGEYEIVGQFRRAYQTFAALGAVDTRVLGVLEKLLKDAKEIRTKYLMHIGQQTYAGISRKLCQQHLKSGEKLLIVGSGDLARDFLRIAVKKFDVTIMARNTERAHKLCAAYGGTVLPLSELPNTAPQFGGIVNTVGVDSLVLFDETFFIAWAQKFALDQRLFVDLGSPSCIQSKLGKRDHLYRIQDVFRLGEELGEETRAKISAAQKRASDLATKRAGGHSYGAVRGGEELGFA